MKQQPPPSQTIPVQGADEKDQQEQRKPREPHERDESSDSQAAEAPSMARVGKRAHDDLAEGQVDTGKSPATDETYERLREGEPKKRPG